MKIEHYQLGEKYFTGQGVSVDLQQAIHYFKLAADLGHSSALFKLGSCYDEGTGVAKDPAEAKKYYELAGRH